MVVDAFLVHWNAPAWCTESVAALLASENVEMRVTVINNAGSLDLPPTVAVVETGRNLGFAGAANVALDLADAPYVFVGCHDIRLAPPAMRALVDLLESDPGLGMAGPVLNGAGDTAHELEWVSGSGMLMRREVAASVRFEERFGSYVEDVEFSCCVRDKGWRIGRAGEAHASTEGSVDSDAALVLMHANMLAFFVKRRFWRQGAQRVKYLLIGAVGRRPEPARLYRRALAKGAVRAVTIGLMPPRASRSG